MQWYWLAFIHPEVPGINNYAKGSILTVYVRTMLKVPWVVSMSVLYPVRTIFCTNEKPRPRMVKHLSPSPDLYPQAWKRTLVNPRHCTTGNGDIPSGIRKCSYPEVEGTGLLPRSEHCGDGEMTKLRKHSPRGLGTLIPSIHIKYTLTPSIHIK
jgi:hypothetical protein